MKTHPLCDKVVLITGGSSGIGQATALRLAGYVAKVAVAARSEAPLEQVAAEGVHVGVVAPGVVDTPLRERVLRPAGRTWPIPPLPPFRIWPVQKCVDRIVRLIVKRRPQANLPWFMGPLFWLDQILAC